jgi:hypothetical protein
MTPEERKAKIGKIRALPALLEDAVRGLNDAQLDTRYREGGWTVRQVVHHVADSHMNAVIRMKLILTEEKPKLKPYDQDSWALLPDVGKVPVSVSLEILRGLHDRWTRLLESVPDNAWKRVGYHPENGDMTLEDVLNTYSAHGEKHAGQITGLRRARGW